MSSITVLKQFDKSQLFRFFVDGRFHKKYNGWVGYEAVEPGSVQAMLNGFAYMMDHFDVTMGLRSGYLIDLHKICMNGVRTTNPKTAPGDLRYLDAGMPFFAKTTTLENLYEILDMRKGDGTNVFHNKAYAKPTEQLDAQLLHQALLRGTTLHYRNWYPNLDSATQNALMAKTDCESFYHAKHKVQIQFAGKADAIVRRFNETMDGAEDSEARLWAIALLVRELELLHPFSDGNCRTFACVLLTQLLLNYEFMPAILENPNLDGERSLAQWVDQIRMGMQHTQILLDEPSAKLFHYSIQEAQQENIEQFAEMSQALVAKIDAHTELFLTPERLATYTGGRWLTACPQFMRFSGVGTHRLQSKGALYFVLELASWQKEGKDVKRALSRIVSRGVKALVMDDAQYAREMQTPVLLVEDALSAFRSAATKVRNALNPWTILVTGTEGKTGAKIQLHHLMNCQARAHAILNSANTEIPVLRSLINLCPDHRFEINEVSVGANEDLRVARAKSVAPDLCLFTNLGPNHMDLHQTIENLLVAKSSVVEGLPEGGLCIVNSANALFDGLVAAIQQRRPDVRVVTYGLTEADDGRLIDGAFDVDTLGWRVHARIGKQELHFRLPLPQQHAPLDSVGVLLAMQHSGLDIQRAAADYSCVQPFETMGRLLHLHKNNEPFLFYDQSRRGGLSGMRSAFSDIARFEVPGKIVALVGGISVLRDNEWTVRLHRQLAEMINATPIDRLYTTGHHMEYVHSHLTKPLCKHSSDIDELANLLVNDICAGDLLFVIGSAYLYLGRVADRVLQLLKEGISPSRAFIGDHPKASEHRLLRVYEAVEKGNGTIKACATNGVRQADYLAALNKIPDFTTFRASLLLDFFNKMDSLLSALRPMRCVDAELSKTTLNRYILKPDFCRQWFNNLDKKDRLPKRQMFGQFFDFGHPKYLLHLEAGTFNLHIGLVLCPRVDGSYAPQRMQANSAREALQSFEWPEWLQLEYRPWGPGWVSLDVGRCIEPTNPIVFLMLVDPPASPLFFDQVRPFVQALGEYRWNPTLS